jgi:hypothetical protein
LDTIPRNERESSLRVRVGPYHDLASVFLVQRDVDTSTVVGEYGNAGRVEWPVAVDLLLRRLASLEKRLERKRERERERRSGESKECECCGASEEGWALCGLVPSSAWAM